MSEALWHYGHPPGSSVHGILQVRVLKWVAMPSSRASSWPRDWTHISCVSCIVAGFFTTVSLVAQMVKRLLQCGRPRFNPWDTSPASPSLLKLREFQKVSARDKAGIQTWVNREYLSIISFLFTTIQSLSHVQLFETLWTAAHQASLSFTISRSLVKLMSIESVMPPNHLIICHPLLLLPSIFPSIRIFSNELVLHITFLCYSYFLVFSRKWKPWNMFWGTNLVSWQDRNVAFIWPVSKRLN